MAEPCPFTAIILPHFAPCYLDFTRAMRANKGSFFISTASADIKMTHEEIQFRLLKILEEHPEMSQRDLADVTGVSLGKLNYCLNALIDKGLVKARNFKNSKYKAAYLYVLTPGGIEEKARLTLHFLQRKVKEYEALKLEIAELERDAARTDKLGLAVDS